MTVVAPAWPLFNKEAHRPISPTSAIGAAAVHMTCADLILAGHMVHQAMEGACYDLVLDARGQLFRVQVKGTNFLRSRSRAEKGYCFNTNRNIRPSRRAEPTTERGLDQRHCDIVALVVLPEKLVAYLPVLRRFPSSMWLYPAGTPSFVRGGLELRRPADSLPIETAISAINVARDEALKEIGE